MTNTAIDTDVIIRFLTGDDPKKQTASALLFAQVEEQKIVLHCPDTVIADAVYVLSSPRLYNLNRQKVKELLATLLALSNFKVANKEIVLSALNIFYSSNLDFGDAMIVAFAQKRKITSIYSFDHDFEKFPSLYRKEPN